MPKFYSRHLRGALADFLALALNSAAPEMIDVFEELAMIRATTLPAAKMYDAALQVEGEKGQELQIAAGAILRDQLREVVSTCESAARINSLNKNQLTPQDVVLIINQIVRIAYEVFEHDIGRAKAFEKAVREQIRITSAAAGTELTPDQDVIEMDQTVPRKPVE